MTAKALDLCAFLLFQETFAPCLALSWYARHLRWSVTRLTMLSQKPPVEDVQRFPISVSASRSMSGEKPDPSRVSHCHLSTC